MHIFSFSVDTIFCNVLHYIFYSGGFIMQANEAIACTVSECTYHDKSENYCTLDKIQVGKNSTAPSKKEDTDCNSFQAKM